MPQRFGPWGGRYVPETLVSALEELEEAYESYRDDPGFLSELRELQTDYAGRPTPLFYAQRLSAQVGCRVYLKREDLAHTGAHKINNTLGQILLAVRMGKKRIIAETGAGQHGVATATVAALFGLECHVYMGEEDIRRQELNVFRMRLLGAEVLPVTSGSGTLKDATNEAIRDWVANVETTHYIIGSVVGPAPYPALVRDFQAVIGRETRAQILDKEGRLPDGLVACVGAGSNAIGLFQEFLDDGAHPAGGSGSGRTGARFGQARSLARPRDGGDPARRLLLRPPGRGRPDPGGALAGRRPGLSLGRARSTRSSRMWAGWSTPVPPTRRPWRRFRRFPGLRGSSPPWRARMRSPTCCGAATGSLPATSWW